jgi:hypothetical protein
MCPTISASSVYRKYDAQEQDSGLQGGRVKEEDKETGINEAAEEEDCVILFLPDVFLDCDAFEQSAIGGVIFCFRDFALAIFRETCTPARKSTRQCLSTIRPIIVN